jgi:hypothetical protein
LASSVSVATPSDVVLATGYDRWQTEIHAGLSVWSSPANTGPMPT